MRRVQAQPVFVVLVIAGAIVEISAGRTLGRWMLWLNAVVAITAASA
jgi:hypothetical protein